MSVGAYSDAAVYRRLLSQARPYWGHIAGLLLLSLLAAPLKLLTPLPLKIAVDSVAGSRPLPDWLDALVPVAVPRFGASMLMFAAGLLLATAVLSQFQDLASALLRTYVGERLVVD